MNTQPRPLFIAAFAPRFLLITAFVALMPWNNAASAFGTDGAITTDIGGTDFAEATARDSSGKIIIVGSTSDGSDSDLVIARYTADGTLDTTFDDDGIKILDIGHGSNDYAKAVVIDSTDRIYVAGYTDRDGTDDFLLIRFIVEDDSGELSIDTDFRDGTGPYIHDISGSTDQANAILLDSSGNIYVGGESNDNFTIARYSSDGYADPGFDETGMPGMGMDGVVTTDFGGDDSITGLALNSEGRIIASGYTSISLSFNVALAKYYPTGMLDTTFGDGDGYVDDMECDSSCYPDALVDSSDRVLVASTRSDVAQQYFVARYASDGTLDTDFGDGDGIFDYDLSSIDAGEYGSSVNLAIDDAGRILMAGTILNSESYFNFVLFRLTNAGALDTSFGSGDGIETHDVGFSFDDITDLILDDSNNVILIGTSSNNFALYATANATCGDSTIEGSETCDDGNTASGDGCSSSCTTETSDDDSSDAESDTDSDNPTDLSGTGSSASSDATSASDASSETSPSDSSSPDSGGDISSTSAETSSAGPSGGGGCALTSQGANTTSGALYLAALTLIVFVRKKMAAS